MSDVNSILLTILLVLASIFIVVLIVVCIKLMYTTDKMNIILTDVEKKLKNVDGVFNTIDHITGSVVTVSDAIVSKILSFFRKK